VTGLVAGVVVNARVKSLVTVPKVKAKVGVALGVFIRLLPPLTQVFIAIQVENVNELVEEVATIVVGVTNFVVPVEMFEEEDNALQRI